MTSSSRIPLIRWESLQVAGKIDDRIDFHTTEDIQRRSNILSPLGTCELTLWVARTLIVYTICLQTSVAFLRSVQKHHDTQDFCWVPHVAKSCDICCFPRQGPRGGHLGARMKRDVVGEIVGWGHPFRRRLGFSRLVKICRKLTDLIKTYQNIVLLICNMVWTKHIYPCTQLCDW